jgi:hypothetical protein
MGMQDFGGLKKLEKELMEKGGDKHTICHYIIVVLL